MKSAIQSCLYERLELKGFVIVCMGRLELKGFVILNENIPKRQLCYDALMQIDQNFSVSINSNWSQRHLFILNSFSNTFHQPTSKLKKESYHLKKCNSIFKTK